MYKDDVTIYFILEGFPENKRETSLNSKYNNRCVVQLSNLSINVRKTKCILFHKQQILEPLHIGMNSASIDIQLNLFLNNYFW